MATTDTHSPAEAEPALLTQTKGAVAYLTLNRPAVRNAMSQELGLALTDALKAQGANEAVRAIVIRGAGKAFSAGGDIGQMQAALATPGQEGRAAYFRTALQVFAELALTLRRTPKPILAAVHGAVAGVAFNLMLGCDLRLAAANTRFTQAFVSLGLSPDGGGSAVLPALVGHARACELTMLPTELDAERAREWGLVNWVVPVEQFATEVERVAQQLASGPSGAIARTKALLLAGCEARLTEQLEAESAAQIANALSADFAEGARAFAQKRPPAFIGR